MGNPNVLAMLAAAARGAWTPRPPAPPAAAAICNGRWHIENATDPGWCVYCGDPMKGDR